MKSLTRKEKLFCLYYAMDQDAPQAAARAGFVSPREAAARLLQREEIRSAVRNCTPPAVREDELLAGYRKLAFGSGADALRLLFDSVPPEQLDQLDLFNVSEIKRPKDGALEIKFFDRLKALEHLEQLARRDDPQQGGALYRALMHSVNDPVEESDEGR